MKKLLTLFCITALMLTGCATERIRNGGFEKTHRSSHEGMMPTKWSASLSPDLFSRRNVKDPTRGVPSNFAGSQECVDNGDNYLGLAMYLQDQVNTRKSRNNIVYCEFVWCKLRKIRNKTITLSFDFSLSDSSCFFSDFIYVAFSQKPPTLSNNGYVFKKNKIRKLAIEQVYDSKNKWIRFSSIIKIERGVRYFAIGNFSNLYNNNNYDNNFISIQNSPCSEAEKSMYLYLDNVSIK